MAEPRSSDPEPCRRSLLSFACVSIFLVRRPFCLLSPLPVVQSKERWLYTINTDTAHQPTAGGRLMLQRRRRL